MKNRILSVILCLVMLMGIIPVFAETQSKAPTAVTVTVSARNALIGEAVTWTMNIDPDNGNLLTRIRVFANGVNVYEGNFTSDSAHKHSYIVRVAGPHYAQAIAYDKTDGASMSANSLVTTVGLRPAPTITGLANVQGKALRLSWKAASGVTGYKVLNATAPGGPYKIVTTIALNYTFSGFTPGTKYYFKLSGYKLINGIVTDVTPQSGYIMGVLVGPAAISTITSTTTGIIKLTWNKTRGATGYLIYRATSSGGTYRYIKSTTSLSYADQGQVPGTTYYYKLKAYNRVSTDTIFYGPLSSYKGIQAI